MGYFLFVRGRGRGFAIPVNFIYPMKLPSGPPSRCVLLNTQRSGLQILLQNNKLFCSSRFIIKKSFRSFLFHVRGRGFEPPSLAALPPQGSASTNFATRAYITELVYKMSKNSKPLHREGGKAFMYAELMTKL